MAEVRISKSIAVFFVLLTILKFGAQSSDLLKEEMKSSRSKRSVMVKTCFEMVSECRKNVSCHKSYRIIKRNCRFFRDTCRAPSTMLTQCFEEINFIKESVFKEKCDCFNGNFYTRNKIENCMDIRNRIFANPCYDFAAKKENDVTSAAGEYGNDVLGRKSPKERNTMSESSLKNLRPPKPPNEPTEEDYRRIDELLASHNEQPREAGPLAVETPNLHSNDVNDVVSSNVRKEPSDQEENLNFANANKRPFASQITQPVTLLSDEYLHDVNDDDEESKGSKVTDANASELAQAVAELMDKSYETDESNDVYKIEEKSEEKSLGPKQTSFDRSPSHVNDDEALQQPSVLNIVFIVLGSVTLLIACLGAVWYFKRGLVLTHSQLWPFFLCAVFFLMMMIINQFGVVEALKLEAKRNDYARGKYLEKSCQSAIIVKPIYDDNDRNVKRKMNRV